MQAAATTPIPAPKTLLGQIVNVHLAVSREAGSAQMRMRHASRVSQGQQAAMRSASTRRLEVFGSEK